MPSESRSLTATKVSCFEIFEVSVGSYIEKCQEASIDGTKVFLHVPKTGGTAIRVALENELPNFINIDRYSDLRRWSAIVDSHEKLPYDMIAGHLRYDSLRQLYERRVDISAITFVRDPADRILSQYRYMVSPKYPDSKNFIEKYPSLEAFVKDGVGENPMVRTLAGDCSSLNEVVEVVSRNYMFVGLTELSAMHSFLVQFCFGLKNFHVPRIVNKTITTDHNRVSWDDDLMKIFREKSGLDIAFYELIKQKHLSIADDVFSSFCSIVFDGRAVIPLSNSILREV